VQERCTDVPGPRVIFAGGGTGGHLFPAIAIADELRTLDPAAEILFIGTKHKIEARVVPQWGYEFRTIWIGGLHRSLRISNLLFPVKVVVSFVQAISIMRHFKPDVVVGTGGYVSGPVLRAAAMRKIPTLIQEQNSYPGVTTRMLAKKANEVHLTFEKSKQYFHCTDNVFVSGNPTRNDLEQADRAEALRYFSFDPSERMKTVLAFGGSLGAHTINQAVERHLGELMKRDLRLVWQTGTEDFPAACEASRAFPGNRIWVNAFIDRMDYAYAASDLVVCRAGATTIAELTRLGKPAMLVPYPHAAGNHQVENAKSLAQAGAAELVLDDQLPERFLPVVVAVLDDARLRQMSKQSKKLGMPNAAHQIAQRIIHLAKVPKPRKAR
jgi:UDP-N-acetylglucosamine--N-acetylmuramyl-(pentapeptide) pyrophosphoryl-undecaprenol N-acetylglucosamine transferase